MESLLRALTSLITVGAIVILLSGQGCPQYPVQGPRVVNHQQEVTYQIALNAYDSPGGGVEFYVVADIPRSWSLVSHAYEGTALGVPISGSGIQQLSDQSGCTIQSVPHGYQRLYFYDGPFSVSLSDTGTIFLTFRTGSIPGLHTLSFWVHTLNGYECDHAPVIVSVDQQSDLTESSIFVQSANDDALFGKHVDIDNGVLFGSAPGDGDSGSIYIFEKIGQIWVKESMIPLPDSCGGLADIAADDSQLVVGCPASGDLFPDGGAVHMFLDTSELGNWSIYTHTVLYPSDPIENHRFGSSVELSGDTLVVAATGDNTSGENGGAIYVLSDIGDDWSVVEETKLTTVEDATGWEIGRTLDFNDGIIAAATKPSVSYVMLWIPSGESEGKTSYFEQKIEPQNPQLQYQCGASISVDNGTLAVGCPNRTYWGPWSGVITLFQDTSLQGDWASYSESVLAPFGATNNSGFGSSVELQGSIMIVSAKGWGGTSATLGTGGVFLLRDFSENKDWSEWNQISFLPEDLSAGDEFGEAISMERTVMVVGAPRNDFAGPDKGLVRVIETEHFSLLFSDGFESGDTSLWSMYQ